MPTRPPLHRPAQKADRDRRHDAHRGTAAERGYDGRWRKARAAFLALHPLCRMCEEQGQVTAATVLDHRIPHKGDQTLFWDPDNWQALCKRHHDRDKQVQEGKYQHRPEWLKPSRIPLTLVCGPALSGKSTFVRTHAAPGDIVLDLDEIACRLAGIAFTHAWDRSKWLAPAMTERNHILGTLSRWPKAKAAWLIASEPEAERRQWWVDHAGAHRVVVIEVPTSECLARLDQDTLRPRQRTIEVIGSWWTRYQPRKGDEIVKSRAD